MTCEYNSAPYELELMKIGITLGEPFKRAKEHHLLVCNHCGHQWSATPVSKLQAFKKYGHNGCPMCNAKRVKERKLSTRTDNVQKLRGRGIEVLDGWDGTTGAGRDSVPVPVTARNVNCGHVFTTTSKNLLNRGIICTVCGIQERSSKLTQTSYDRSEEWRKTATEWKIYKSNVTKLTRKNYNQHKDTINPNDLPTGKAGTDGAYHVDHIVPIRYCFDNGIPEEACAHFTNLQMLGWRENVGSRDKLKDNVPAIFETWITVAD